MGVSAIDEQRQAILDAIKSITRGDWKVLVIDEATKKIVFSVLKEDDILNENIANVETLESRREMNPGMDAIYLLSPEPHVVDCLLADFERRRYRKSFLVWVALLDPTMRRRIDSSRQAQEQLGGWETLSIDFYPRESHLITFRDPWSFPILFHPACAPLVRDHMQLLAQKITGICVSLGESPKIRYYRPKNPTHEAAVLCSHLARFVQEELDAYQQYNPSFPPQSNRPQGVLLITDRSMDTLAPILHEFTYQAMAHDLLPIKDHDKVTYTTVLNEGTAQEEEKEMEITEKDKIWVENRHQHMSKTIQKLMSDFKKFIADNPHFANQDAENVNISQIKDIHGLDEDYRKPKEMGAQVVRLLDNPAVAPKERLRLIILYVIFRDGLITEDLERLLHHSGLPLSEMNEILNLELLGVHTTKKLTDSKTKAVPTPLFPPKPIPTVINEELALSRYETNLQRCLEEITKGTLDPNIFPYTRPPTDPSEEMALQSQASLRSAKPTWARGRSTTPDNMQRIIVFMAGGATYSEARACYEISKDCNRDVFLATSHMLNPNLFLKQVGDLTAGRKQLDLPIDRPKPKAPAYLFKANDPPPPPPVVASPRPQVGLGLPGGPGSAPGGVRPARSPGAPAPPMKSPGYDSKPLAAGMQQMSLNGAGDGAGHSSGKLEKKKGEDGKEKKKKMGFFRSKK
ncbi:putative sec1 family superfamily protein [Botrytis fragariae]|uniref:Putative sec1 family superfamily protein n=1 Tax=Botrytis fragariae TaxID=1964551 RepID=A0A8H6ARN5_9HELO|nr:putative sec1 family superfamily protein [Botrytis fragariae]KAF5872293.1 putative sec1 family superfamily protein [Botrytis fragariae]